LTEKDGERIGEKTYRKTDNSREVLGVDWGKMRLGKSRITHPALLAKERRDGLIRLEKPA